MKIGAYEVVGTLGRGGMGVVYSARSPDGRDVAIKVLRKSDRDVLARFERERRLLASFGEAEGFVGLLDAGTTPAGPFLVMPLVPGGTLRKKIEAGPLGIEEAVALGRALAAALGAAHGRGVVHRDMKPENVLFTAAGRPLVADLGLAKHWDPRAPGASQSVSLSLGGEFRGTAGYMAPEQMADAKAVGPAADVYALGAILYECLAGEAPFVGDNVLELLARVSDGELEPLRERRPEVPPWLAGVVERALAKKAEDRFPDGLALERALVPADRGRRRVGPILVGVSLLGVLAAVGLAVSRNDAPSVVLPPKPPDPPVVILPMLPPGLRLAGRKVPAADAKEVELYLWKLPGEAGEIELVSVPAGQFFMGADDKDAAPDESPRHAHALDHGFWIGRNDVTWAQYRAFVAATGAREPEKPSFWEQVAGTKSDHPVVMVSWEEARAYAAWAGLALPGEAEWEKAARGADGRRYPWGDAWEPGSRCNFVDADCPLDTLEFGKKKATQAFEEQGLEWDRDHRDGYPFTSPAGSFPRGASPSGALDMAGNVWQWCEDRYDEKTYVRYARGDMSPPIDGTDRVRRGGSWRLPARSCRSSNRAGNAPSVRRNDFGFRVVLRAAP